MLWSWDCLYPSTADSWAGEHPWGQRTAERHILQECIAQIVSDRWGFHTVCGVDIISARNRSHNSSTRRAGGAAMVRVRGFVALALKLSLAAIPKPDYRLCGGQSARRRGSLDYICPCSETGQRLRSPATFCGPKRIDEAAVDPRSSHSRHSLPQGPPSDDVTCTEHEAMNKFAVQRCYSHRRCREYSRQGHGFEHRNLPPGAWTCHSALSHLMTKHDPTLKEPIGQDHAPVTDLRTFLVDRIVHLIETTRQGEILHLNSKIGFSSTFCFHCDKSIRAKEVLAIRNGRIIRLFDRRGPS